VILAVRVKGGLHTRAQPCGNTKVWVEVIEVKVWVEVIEEGVTWGFVKPS
jgi:hypothetical protein